LTTFSAKRYRYLPLRAASIPGYIARTYEREPLTLQQAEFLRRWAKDPILRKDTGFGSLDATRMAGTGGKIEQAMSAYDERVGQYIQRYKAGKETERMALGKKKGEGVLEEAAKTEDEILFSSKPQQVTNYYLDGTKESANKLVRLVGGKSPELVNRVKANVRGKVENMDAAKTQEFIAKNEGMLQTFPEIRDSLNKLVQSRQAEERLSSMLGKTKGRLEKALGAEITATEKLSEKVARGKEAVAPYQQFMEKFEGAEGKEIFSESKSIADKLRNDEIISGPKYQELLSQIRDIEQRYTNQQEAKARLKTIFYTALVPTVGYGGYRVGKDIFGLSGF
jgi:hypothetical protein